VFNKLLLQMLFIGIDYLKTSSIAILHTIQYILVPYREKRKVYQNMQNASGIFVLSLRWACIRSMNSTSK